MKRNIREKLINWKDAKSRKPLLLTGPRQVGKTYCLEELGKNDFDNYYLFDFMENPSLEMFFEQDLSPKRIIRDLSIFIEEDINIDEDLIIFDEIQQCPKALTSLKFFAQQYPKAYIAASGSLLGLGLSDESFPVGKVHRIELYPMNFEEYLEAIGKEKLVSLLASTSPEQPLNEAFHQKVWTYFKYFMITGGLPEVVGIFRDKMDTLVTAFSDVRRRQAELTKDYINDIPKHSGKIKAVRISAVLKNIPIQLAQERTGVKKFVFKDVLPTASRYSLLEAPIEWLIKAGLVIKVPICNTAALPLKAFAEEKRFKLYMFDVGILGSMLELSPKTIFSYDYGSYKGYFAENIVLTEMTSQYDKTLYSWSQNNSEIEFLTEFDGKIIPIEVKAGINTKAKSLTVYNHRFSPKFSLLLSGRPMMPNKGNMIQLPLYLSSRFSLYL